MKVTIKIRPIEELDIELKPIEEQVDALNDMNIQISKGAVKGIIYFYPIGRGMNVPHNWTIKSK